MISLIQASYTKNNIKNYINSYNKLDHQIKRPGNEGGIKEGGIMSIPKEDRETLFKRAEDGHATQSDLFLILRGKTIRNSIISFPEVELIYRRLGISLTEHRFCEFLSATKLASSKNSLSETRLNFSLIEETEFDSLYEYIEGSVTSYGKETLKISPRSLMNFSLITFLIYLFIILLTSNLMTYFYGGDLVGSILCALLPIGIQN